MRTAPVTKRLPKSKRFCTKAPTLTSSAKFSPPKVRAAPPTLVTPEPAKSLPVAIDCEVMSQYAWLPKAKLPDSPKKSW